MDTTDARKDSEQNRSACTGREERTGRGGGSGPEPGNWHPGIPQVGTSGGWGGGPGWIYNLSSL